VLTHVSASQIKDFRACNRLWFYTRILKQRAPQTEAQSRGTTVHGALEAHLKAGKIEPDILERAKGLGITEKDLADYVASMEPFVGKPGEGLTEHRDSMATYEGGPEFVLVVDHAREITVEGHGTIPQIDDLKTTSDFRYCKTPDELSKDVQMISYAKWALWRLFEQRSLPPPTFVSLRHVYVRTRGKRVATARDVLVTPADVETRWAAILDDVRDMESLAAIGSEVNPQDVPATTTDHCSAYGGCFFRVQCFGAVYDTNRPFLGLFNKETKESVMADGNVLTPNFPANGVPTAGGRTSLKDRVAARKAAASGSAPVAPSVPPASAPALASVPSTAPAPAALCGDVHAMFPAYPCNLVPHEGDHESKGPTGGAIWWRDAETFGIGQSKNWKALAAATPVAVAAPLTAASVLAAFSPSSIAQVLPPDAAPRTSTPEEVAAANAPARRKRATKAEMEARASTGAVVGAPGVPTEQPAVGTTAPASVAAATAVAPVVAVACPLEILYIDSFPVKNGGAMPTMAEGLLAELAVAAAQAAGVPDWRLVEFGKGKGAMAIVLRERLAQVPRELVVSTSTPGSDVIIEVLSPHAKRIVRALRG
jgi:hypothetical protein